MSLKTKNLIGLKYGKLLVVAFAGKNKHKQHCWLCKCDCGKEKVIVGGSLVGGYSKSCGCSRIKNILNMRFGRLVVKEMKRSEKYGILWKCLCDCGNIVFVLRYSLISGNTKSCGCLSIEQSRKRAGENHSSKRPEVRKKMSENHYDNSGCRNGRWQGGVSKLPYCEKWNSKLQERIRAFFDYECVLCGKPQSENIDKNGKVWNLSCHHVDYNKQVCCDNDLVARFAALCLSCHGKTGYNKERWQEIIHRIIDEIYNGKSYYTKEEWKQLKQSYK